ncbi:putative zinc finger protein [Chitinophaga skermanii]|uniref:Putative zinc finger protein n=1 Tax=Chitinophaga skermanii TaxID=331697 RepID=A0A327QQI9_9BACT|nr:zf-HC2 domain-containing protein [Chitinophaga skermanii]RAJ06856.1 putative zinc finger protein [Chitinophaga skermanii]
MNDNFRDIFEETDCLSQQTLMDYLQGKLSGEELHHVEQHIADCELCSDALEGLQAIKQKEKIPFWLRDIKWQLMKKLRKKNHRKRKLRLYVNVLVITLILLILLFMMYWVLFEVRRGH